MSDNILKFPYKIRRTEKPVEVVCQIAADCFEENNNSRNNKRWSDSNDNNHKK